MVDGERRNALDFAIDFYHEDVVEEILKSDKWKEALSNAILTNDEPDYQCITPMRKLIQSMPEMAKLVLNRCTEVQMQDGDKTQGIWEQLQNVERKTLESAELQIRFNYDFMDDDYAVLKWEKKNGNDMESFFDVKSTVNGSIAQEEQIQPYATNNRALLQNHPLNFLVEFEREDLITHPLVISLYSSKWRAIGFWVYSSNLALYAIFMVQC